MGLLFGIRRIFQWDLKRILCRYQQPFIIKNNPNNEAFLKTTHPLKNVDCCHGIESVNDPYLQADLQYRVNADKRTKTSS